MKRREFITLLGGAAAAWPLAARAQQPKVPTIGALVIGNADPEEFWREFRQGLRDLGYVEGQNVRFEFRSAEGQVERVPELAAELVHLKVDVMAGREPSSPRRKCHRHRWRNRRAVRQMHRTHPGAVASGTPRDRPIPSPNLSSKRSSLPAKPPELRSTPSGSAAERSSRALSPRRRRSGLMPSSFNPACPANAPPSWR